VLAQRALPQLVVEVPATVSLTRFGARLVAGPLVLGNLSRALRG
jgi:hypothetical protein